MKISVRVKGDWFAVPVAQPQFYQINWLCEQALRKYVKIIASRSSPSGGIHDESVYEMRKAKGGAILDPEDVIADVLDDNDFVSLVLESDRTKMTTGNLEVYYVPEIASTEQIVVDKEGERKRTFEVGSGWN